MNDSKQPAQLARWFFVASCVVLVSGRTAGAAEPESPKASNAQGVSSGPVITPSKATTFATGPVDAEGYVDFTAALDVELGRGIAPNDNAVIPLLRALGPNDGNIEVTNLVLHALGQPPWQPGELDFVEEGMFLKESLGANAPESSEQRTFAAQFEQTRNQPWKDADFPLVAKLLARNEAPLAAISAAVQRPKYYRPHVRRNPHDSLIMTLLPDVQQSRDVARQLQRRSLRAMSGNDLASARDDIMTMLRLGRHVSQGGTLIEGLVGIAIESMALSTANVWVIHPAQTTESLAEFQQQRAALPPLADPARAINFAERYMGLEVVQNLARGRHPSLWSDLRGLGVMQPEGESVPTIDVAKIAQALAGFSVDWNTAMETMNGSYDGLVEVIKLPTRSERLVRMQELQLAAEQSRERTASFSGLVVNVLGGNKTRGRTFGETVSVMLTPAVTAVSEAYDRWQTRVQLMDVLIAAAQYRCQHGAYPESLVKLTPDFLAEIPPDIYSGAALIYRIDGDTMRIYSVGKNGRDDGGIFDSAADARGDLAVSDPPQK